MERSGCRTALWGAVIGQIIVCCLVFLKGAFFGENPVMSAVNNTSYGLEGGKNALGGLVFVYVLSLGIAPIIVSLIGAGSAIFIQSIQRPSNSKSKNTQRTRSHHNRHE